MRMFPGLAGAPFFTLLFLYFSAVYWTRNGTWRSPFVAIGKGYRPLLLAKEMVRAERKEEVGGGFENAENE